MTGVGFHFGSQMADMNPNGFNVIIWVVSPNFFQNFAGCNSLAMALQQAMQQLLTLSVVSYNAAMSACEKGKLWD